MNNSQQIIHPAYTDPVFKYLMFQDDIRNAFLSAILKKTVLESQMADPSLSPFDDNHEARALIEELMQKENIQRLENLSSALETPEQDLLKKVAQCLPLVQEMFPDKQRLTTLDIVCKTADQLINIEIQVVSQAFWDLRMLVHGGGLVFKQIQKGFRWETISSTGVTLNKHKKAVPAFRETIVVGLLLNPPVSRPAEALKAMPWYETSRWKEGEVARSFHICKDNDLSVKMPGLIFHQYNLNAVSKDAIDKEDSENKKLFQWLDLFGHSSEKRLSEVECFQQDEPVLWKAYEMLTHLPTEISQDSEKELAMYQITEQERDVFRQIGLEEGREEGREEERLELAKKMLKKNLPIEAVSEFCSMSAEQLESIKKSL